MNLIDLTEVKVGDVVSRYNPITGKAGGKFVVGQITESAVYAGAYAGAYGRMSKSNLRTRIIKADGVRVVLHERAGR